MCAVNTDAIPAGFQGNKPRPVGTFYFSLAILKVMFPGGRINYLIDGKIPCRRSQVTRLLLLTRIFAYGNGRYFFDLVILFLG